MNKQELQNCCGGGWITITLVAGGVVTWIMGCIDGYFYPKKCN